MTTAAWIGNAASIAQVETGVVTAVTTGGTVRATINRKTISYTVLVTDTVSTAAAALFNLLSNTAVAPPEFNEITWANTGATITATAQVPGTPFAGMTNGLVFSATGGCTMTQTATTANTSPSDVFDANNWMRGASVGLPQDGDDMVVGDSSVPLLWNLDKLVNLRLNSYTRYQSFQGTIGLNENNPLGYVEYRPTYFQLAGPSGSSSSSSSVSAGQSGVLNVVLGFGQNGTGPSRERYNFGSQQYSAIVLAAGTPANPYSVRLLGTNGADTIRTTGVSVGVAMLPGETSTLASAFAGAGGSIALGPTVTFSGTLTVDTQSSADLNCAPATVIVQNGSQLFQGTLASNPALQYSSMSIIGGSSVTWLSGSGITTLLMQTGSRFDKSQDWRAMTVGTATIDSDCIVNDPLGVMSFTNPVTVKNQINSGPFRTAGGRTFRIV